GATANAPAALAGAGPAGQNPRPAGATRAFLPPGGRVHPQRPAPPARSGPADRASIPHRPSNVKTAIRERARELGFDACQFTTARPPDSAAHFQHWLEAGRHGQMTYLERNACKRIEPSQVLAAARSIITLGVSYAGDEARRGGQGEMLQSRMVG